MKHQEYLEDKLKNCAIYQLSEEDKKELAVLGMKGFLFKQITRKKFRRWKLPELAHKRIDQALDYCIKNDKPIVFRFRFGGYKLWRLESSPEVDWAEFFTLSYYSEYLAPIIAVHKPGVKLLFASDDVFVERLDNIPKSDTEAYYQSFQKLCNEFKKYAPDNFLIEMKKHSSLFSTTEEFEKEFSDKMAEIESDWLKNQHPDNLKKSLATSALNIRWDGVEDLTGLSEEEKNKKIIRSAIMHEALVQMPTIRAFSDNTPGMIFVFTTKIPSVVSIGTTKTSIVRFWVGTGVLEEREDKYLEHILSPSQIDKVKDKDMVELPVDLIPLRNFSKIKIYKNILDFTLN